jgi:hypothetical protein
MNGLLVIDMIVAMICIGLILERRCQLLGSGIRGYRRLEISIHR